MNKLKETTTTNYYIDNNNYYDIYNRRTNKLLYTGIINISDGYVNTGGNGTFYCNNSNRVKYNGEWIYNHNSSSLLNLNNFSYKNILKHGSGVYINRHTTYAYSLNGTFLFNKFINGKKKKRTKTKLYYYRYTDDKKYLTKKKKIELISIEETPNQSNVILDTLILKVF